MNKLKSVLLIALFTLSFSLFSNSIKALESQIAFSPSQIIVKETDLGKKYIITITNTTNTDYTFLTEEKSVKKTDNTLDLIETTPLTKRLEIMSNEFKVKSNSKFELTVRVKIFSNESFEALPALLIKEKADPKNQLKVLIQSVIPFIVQNKNGNFKIDNTFTLNAQNYTIDPKVIITGTASNNGTKFCNLSGTVLISKNGVVIDEKELTSQINGLIFPNEKRNYLNEWNISKDYFDGLGEYTIESRINNDETDTTSVMKISFIYIPKNLILTVAGAVLGIGLIISIINIIKKSKRK